GVECQFAQEILLERVARRTALNELPEYANLFKRELVIRVFSFFAMDKLSAVKILIDNKSDLLQQVEVEIDGTLCRLQVAGQLAHCSSTALRQRDEPQYPKNCSLRKHFWFLYVYPEYSPIKVHIFNRAKKNQAPGMGPGFATG